MDLSRPGNLLHRAAGAFPLALLLATAPAHAGDIAVAAPFPARLSVTLSLMESCRGLTLWSDCATAIERRQAATGRFTRKGGLLDIPIPGHAPRILEDRPVPTEWTEVPVDSRTHSYVEYLPAIHQHLVLVLGWEWSSYAFVDARTGEVVEVPGLPIFSPDGRRFAIGVFNEWGSESRLEIWRATARGLTPELQKDLDFPPSAPAWVGEYELVVPHIEAGTRPPAVFRLVGQAWQDWQPFPARLSVTQALMESCRGLTDADLCSKVIERRQAAAGRFKRDGDVLRIPIPGRPAVELKDAPAKDVGTNPGDEAVRYGYIEFISPAGQHLVHVAGYEGSEFLLVDSKTGARTLLLGLPVPSPDGTRFACGAMIMAVDLWRLEVWRATGEGLERELSIELPFGPGIPNWRGPDALEVPAVFPEKRPAMFLHRTGTGWMEAPPG